MLREDEWKSFVSMIRDDPKAQAKAVEWLIREAKSIPLIERLKTAHRFVQGQPIRLPIILGRDGNVAP